jgi:hypothetical protein
VNITSYNWLQNIAKNHKILLFSDQCAAHLKNHIFISNIKVVFLPANYTTQPQPLNSGIIHAIKRHYRKQLIQKTAAMRNGRLLGCVVCSDMIAKTWRLTTPTTMKNCFVKCGFSIDQVSSNNGSAVKMKRMTSRVSNLLECSLRTTQHVTVLSRFVESRMSTSC